MAEPPRAGPASAVAPERDVLLATKLHMPASRPGLVPRPRLAEWLDEGQARGMILVCAPAGYGKTVVLADLARRSEYPAGWLSLDAADNDPARFWRHAVAALDRARPGIGDRVAPLLGPPAPASFEGLVTALLNELATRPAADGALLVLDDYHVIGSPPVHESLGFLLQHRPPGLCVVLASRSNPPLGLARLRARGQLAELRAAELRFTPGEAAALLRHVAAGSGPALPDAAVAALAERTEGWAAGLQLAGLSLRGQHDVAAFVAAFTGSHRYVLDYLAEEVLERQSAQVRTFLLETSVLERLSGPLCDAVTGRAGSQALLEQVERAGLFLVPLDEVRGWWRYHHLFADLLRARLQAEQPGRAAQLHHNAAAWYEQHGLADEAIMHAAAAGEMTWAAAADRAAFRRRCSISTAKVRRFSAGCRRCPMSWSGPGPGCCWRGRSWRATRGQRGGSGAAARCGRAASPGWRRRAIGAYRRPGPQLAANVPALIALHRSYLAQLRGDAEATVVFASRAMAEAGEDEWLLGLIARWNLGVGEWLRGRLAEAERAFVSCTAGWRAAGQHTVTAWGIYLPGPGPACPGPPGRRGRDLPAGARGRPSPAALRCQRPARRMCAWPRWPTSETSSTQRWLMSPTASRCAASSSTRRRWPPDWLPWRGSARPPAIRPARCEAISQAEQASPSPAGLLNPVPAQRAQLLLAQGDLHQAARFAQDQGIDRGRRA